MKKFESVALLVTAIAVGPAAAAAQRLGPAGGVTTLSNGVILAVAPAPAPASSPPQPRASVQAPVRRLQRVSSAILQEALKAADLALTPSGEPFTVTPSAPLVAGKGALKASDVTFDADSNFIRFNGSPLSSVSVFTSGGTPTNHYMIQFTVATDCRVPSAPFILFGPGNGVVKVYPTRCTSPTVQEILLLVTLPDNVDPSTSHYLGNITRPNMRETYIYGVQVTPM